MKVLHVTKMATSILPKNTEKICSLRIGPYVFHDTMSFLNGSLADMVDILVKDNHDFPYLKKLNFSERQIEFSKRKGVYPYSFVTSIKQLLATKELPEKKHFFNDLSLENVEEKDYIFAKQFWEEFKCKNLMDYTMMYCKIDVYLLCECFLKFRNVCLLKMGLDVGHYLTLPSFSYHLMLRMTDAKIQMPPIDIFNFFAKSIRGGHSFISQRLCHSLRPKSERETLLKKKIAYIIKKKNQVTNKKDQQLYLNKLKKLKKMCCYKDVLFVDENNMYGRASALPLPYSHFKWLDKEIIKKIPFSFYKNYDLKDEYGFCAEVTLAYPKELHLSHSSFPLAPESIEVTSQLLSPFSKKCLRVLGKKVENFRERKLTATFFDRKNYVVHGANLALYLQLGMKLKKVHRVVIFKQKPFMKKFIDCITNLRQKSKTLFEKNTMKLIVNSNFGKTLENKFNRMNAYLCTNEEKLRKIASKIQFTGCKIISEKSVIAHSIQPTR